MLDEWGLEDDELGSDGRTPFDDLLEEFRDDETTRKAGSSYHYAPFETNHPLLDVEATGQERDHQIARLMRWYGHRWGIENGFKKLKKFLVRTTSHDECYRFFSFAFACVLYNVWRLVDLLVKLAVEDDPDYAPRVSSNLFLTLCKQYFGLDPP